jgi:hypothetical protein
MSRPTKLSQVEVNQLVAELPDLPSDYLTYLVETGWGEAASGHMVYSGPVLPEEVFGPDHGLRDTVLLGDDFQGYCLAFNLATKQYGEISDFGEWEPWPAGQGIAEYVIAGVEEES